MNGIEAAHWLDAWPVALRSPKARQFRLRVVPLGEAATLCACWEPRRTMAWWAARALAHEDHGTGWPSTVGHHHHVMGLARVGVRTITLLVTRGRVWDGNHRIIAALVNKARGAYAPKYVGLVEEVKKGRRA